MAYTQLRSGDVRNKKKKITFGNFPKNCNVSVLFPELNHMI